MVHNAEILSNILPLVMIWLYRGGYKFPKNSNQKVFREVPTSVYRRVGNIRVFEAQKLTRLSLSKYFRSIFRSLSLIKVSYLEFSQYFFPFIRYSWVDFDFSVNRISDLGSVKIDLEQLKSVVHETNSTMLDVVSSKQSLLENRINKMDIFKGWEYAR